MKKIGQLLIKSFTLLPFPLIDILSFFIYFLIRYIFRYRIKVVSENIKQSFPEWSKEKVKETLNSYYLHFIDLSIETLKGLTMSEQKFTKHFKFTNNEILDKYFDKGKNVVVLSGHFANWEWLNTIGLNTYYLNLAVYLPLKNKFWDNLIKQIRQRFGAEAVPMRQIFRRMIELRMKNVSFLVGLVSDQCPPADKAVWSTFLNRDTAYYGGPDKIARMLDAPVFYMSVKKTRRHYYEASYQLLSENVKNLPTNEIIHKFSAALEKDVRLHPEMYIWSHKRWKYSKKTEP